MLIFIDKRIPDEAKQNLTAYGQLIEIESTGLVYDSISGHPDIFFCQINNQLIIAPNTPTYLINILKSKNVNFIIGEKNLSKKYPSTTHYNAVVSHNYLIHNLKYTDKKIENSIGDRQKIRIRQSYSRCNLIEISEDVFITSDIGMYKKFNEIGNISVFYIDPVQISLPGHSYGFFGGCCGVYNNKLFIIGSLDYLEEKENLKVFLEINKVDVVELTHNVLFDGGGIFFIEN